MAAAGRHGRPTWRRHRHRVQSCPPLPIRLTPSRNHALRSWQGLAGPERDPGPGSTCDGNLSVQSGPTGPRQTCGRRAQRVRYARPPLPTARYPAANPGRKCRQTLPVVRPCSSLAAAAALQGIADRGAPGRQSWQHRAGGVGVPHGGATAAPRHRGG